jgi:hypothetical protein
MAPAKKAKGKRDIVQEEIIGIFRHCFDAEDEDIEILETDPSDLDEDPGEFYEIVEERFGVPRDPDDEDAGGFGGPVEVLVDHIAERWDGDLREVAEDYGYGAEAEPDVEVDEDASDDDVEDEDEEEDDDDEDAEDE